MLAKTLLVNDEITSCTTKYYAFYINRYKQRKCIWLNKFSKLTMQSGLFNLLQPSFVFALLFILFSKDLSVNFFVSLNLVAVHSA